MTTATIVPSDATISDEQCTDAHKTFTVPVKVDSLSPSVQQFIHDLEAKQPRPMFMVEHNDVVYGFQFKRFVDDQARGVIAYGWPLNVGQMSVIITAEDDDTPLDWAAFRRSALTALLRELQLPKAVRTVVWREYHRRTSDLSKLGRAGSLRSIMRRIRREVGGA